MENQHDRLRENSKRAFNELARVYNKTFAGRHSHMLYRPILEKLDMITFSSVLDVGCGQGNLLSLILEDKEVDAAGIDIAEEMVEVARERLGNWAQIVVGDVEKLPWEENRFDVVISSDAFHHFIHPIKVAGEFIRVLKPGGCLILADVWWPVPIRQLANLLISLPGQGDVRIYSKSEIMEIIQARGFKKSTWERIDLQAYVLTAMAPNRVASEV